MKYPHSLLFIATLLLVFGKLWAQEEIEKSALLQATQMVNYYNSKDFMNYVNFLLPQTYGNDLANKEMLVNNFLLKNPFSYQIVLIDNDDYSITSFPTHVVIDQDLKVVDKLTGYSPDNIKVWNVV